MPDVLRTALCGIGALYLVIRLARFLGALLHSHPLSKRMSLRDPVPMPKTRTRIHARTPATSNRWRN